MRPSNFRTIAKREYLARLRSKGFWISTIALPVMMAAWAILPSLMVAKARTSQKLAVVDRTHQVAELLQQALDALAKRTADQVSFELEVVQPQADVDSQRAALDQRVLDEEIAAWIWIDSELLAENRVEYHAESVSNFITQQALIGALSAAVQKVRLVESGYDPEIVAELSSSIDLDTVRISEAGSSAEGGLGGFALAFAVFMVLYMTTLIYGQQVMLGVLEEKSSRVVEVLLSTVAPFDLMAGKIAGIGLAGLTQIAIWFATAAVLTAPGVVAIMAFLPAGTELPTLSPILVLHFFLLFILGYFFYATFYAMIGSAFNNPQEAQQMASLAVIFVVLPWIFFLPILNDPDSTLAVVTSLIPIFTPFLMVLRIAVKMPPTWQILLGYFLTTAMCAGMIWLCARIYRVGILMYGKKPSLKELWRWVRYA
ncbi:MAG: ABC transporter permease [Nitrospirae bacterium]|nr:ABC transporter permease [Nitrospirota bacterium]